MLSDRRRKYDKRRNHKTRKSDLLETKGVHELILPYGLGFISSFIVSYYTLRWLISIVKKGNLKYFSLYTLLLGLLILIFM